MGLEQYNQEKLSTIDNKILDDVNRVIKFDNTINALNSVNPPNYVKAPDSDNAFASNLFNTSNSFNAFNSLNALNSLENLNEEQLTNYIKKSFQNNDGTRFTYSHMKQNQYYPFMVQSAIDLLSNKLGNKKYNVDGSIDETQGKTLDEWVGEAGGIDNSYGPKTRDVVKIVQRILHLEPVDGLAGPRFFANICAKLTGESIGTFNVEGYDNNNKYKHNLDNDAVESEARIEATNEINKVKKIIEHIGETNKTKDIVAIKCDGNRIYYGINRGSGAGGKPSSDYERRYSKSNPVGDVGDIDLNRPRSWESPNLKPSYGDVKDAMRVGEGFLDIRYNQVLKLKNAYMNHTHGEWPKNDSFFLAWADEFMIQKDKWTVHNRKDLAKWCVKKDGKSMGRDFLERGEKMTKKGLPADKITIKTRVTLRDAGNISQIVV